MLKLARSFAVPALLLLLTIAGVVIFTEAPGAAKSRQAQSSAPDSGDVRMVITTSQGSVVSEHIVAITGSTQTFNSSSVAAPTQTAAAGDIVLSQIYSRGGESGSTYQNNYLELFNRTNNPINISGWRFRIADATGPFTLAIAFTSSQGINIGAGQYFLMQFGPASPNGAPLPNPDIVVPFHFDPPPGFPPIPDINLFPSGKVALMLPNTSLFNACPVPDAGIVDFVGYGSTTVCFEGGGPVPTLSSTTAAVRGANGCSDINYNNLDFAVSTPAARNTSSALHFCNGTPPQIQFSQSRFDVTENPGSIAVVVQRTGDTSGASLVDYNTSDNSGGPACQNVNGRASSLCDYTAGFGTLKFAAGESSKSISIPLIDDVYVEGTEIFSVNLSNPIAGTLGAPTTTDIFVQDNDTTTTPTPIDQSSFFVRQHYIDFLNREPDTAGNNFWIDQIENCTPKPQCTEIKRVNVSAAFFLSIESQESGYLAYRAYKAAYGDATGQAMVQGVPVQIFVPMIRLNEFLADSHAIGEGVICCSTQAQQTLENNKVAYFNAFVLRQRFLTDYPLTMTPAQFVDKLNLRSGDVLSISERNTLVTELQNTQKTRAQVVRAVAEDSDMIRVEKNRAFVLMQYFGYLRRNPNDPLDTDYTGYKFWLDKLNQFNGNFVDADMVKAFITSGEYRHRFG